MKFAAAMLLVFTVLTAVMTYPQVRHLRECVHDDGEPLLGTWIFAWVAHQLPRAPAHIFDANMFYPERRTLALQETMLLPGAAAAPLHWLGVHPRSCTTWSCSPASSSPGFVSACSAVSALYVVVRDKVDLLLI